MADAFSPSALERAYQVAADASASPEDLLHAAGIAPREVLQNPALPLLSLVEPAAWASITGKARGMIAGWSIANTVKVMPSPTKRLLAAAIAERAFRLHWRDVPELASVRLTDRLAAALVVARALGCGWKHLSAKRCGIAVIKLTGQRVMTRLPAPSAAAMLAVSGTLYSVPGTALSSTRSHAESIDEGPIALAETLEAHAALARHIAREQPPAPTGGELRTAVEMITGQRYLAIHEPGQFAP